MFPAPEILANTVWKDSVCYASEILLRSPSENPLSEPFLEACVVTQDPLRRATKARAAAVFKNAQDNGKSNQIHT